MSEYEFLFGRPTVDYLYKFNLSLHNFIINTELLQVEQYIVTLVPSRKMNVSYDLQVAP